MPRLCALLLLGLGWALPASASAPAYTIKAWKWTVPDVVYTIHPDNWDLPIEQVIAASQAADAILNALPTHQPKLRYGGLSSVAPSNQNGRSEVWAVAGTHPTVAKRAADGTYWGSVGTTINEGDLKVYSGAYTFLPAGDSACVTSNVDVNLLALFVHEKLHTLGLGHSLVAGATMTETMPGTSCGREWESPEADDLAALTALYQQQTQVRTFLQVPVNFRNDTSKPSTLAQLKADGDALGELVFGVYNSYGAVTTTSTVLDYVTVDMDKGCNGPGANLPALNMAEFEQKVNVGLVARNQPTLAVLRTQYTYVYIVSPTTFTKYCSHTNRYGYAFDTPLSARDTGTILSWRLGLPLAINWACRQAAGSSIFVTLSAFCAPSSSTANGRDITSLPGQGSSGFPASDRHRLGFLPASHQTTVTATQGQWTLKHLENPALGLKRLLIPAMGVELSYHAPDTGWDWRGVTGHLINSSARIDFTPDDRWIFGTTALAPSLSWTYNNLTLTVLSAEGGVAVVDLRPAGAAPMHPAPSAVTWQPSPSTHPAPRR